MFRVWIILTVCICAVLGRRIGGGKTRNIHTRLDDNHNNDPVVAAEGKVLQKIKSDIYQLEKEEADVEMDIMNRLNRQNQREKLPYLAEVDDEDQYLVEGSGRRGYYFM